MRSPGVLSRELTDRVPLALPVYFTPVAANGKHWQSQWHPSNQDGQGTHSSENMTVRVYRSDPGYLTP
jgi:hypothetical protein